MGCVKLGEKIAFTCLLWVNRPQINYPISRNPWEVIIFGPVHRTYPIIETLMWLRRNSCSIVAKHYSSFKTVFSYGFFEILLISQFRSRSHAAFPGMISSRRDDRRASSLLARPRRVHVPLSFHRSCSFATRQSWNDRIARA